VKLLTVDTIDEAREKILQKLKPYSPESEIISLEEAQNRILAADIFSPCDIPGFRRSIVDGYALLASDTAGAGETVPVFLKKAPSVAMGKAADFSIGSGEAAYVPTGGMLPAGADAVVMIEFCESAGGSIAVYEPAAPGAGMVETGEDLRKGSPLLGKGARIRPQEAGLLAAAGITELPVFVPLKLCVISTGNELVPPEQVPGPGEIRDINTHIIKALALKRGYSIVSTELLPDDGDRLQAAIRKAMISSDVVVISGGSSQGEKDLTAEIINRTAKPGGFTHGLALKPGKPTILGWDEESRTLLAGLPGHPVAAIVVFDLLMGWLHDKLFSLRPSFPVPARISSNLPGSPGRMLCQPVMLKHYNATNEAGVTNEFGVAYSAEPVFGKSGMITTMTRADGYIVIDMNKEGLKKDEFVLVHLL
jgi:molybdopterin molybdotransferase